MIDKKGRIFGKVSVIDLFVLAALIAIFLVVYMNVGASGRPDMRHEQPVLLTFFSPALEDYIVDAIETGAPIFRDDDGTFFGTIVGVDRGESISFMPDRQGIETASPMEGFSSVRVHSRVYAPFADGAVVLGGNTYANGMNVEIWAGRAFAQFRIHHIQAEDE